MLNKIKEGIVHLNSPYYIEYTIVDYGYMAISETGEHLHSYECTMGLYKRDELVHSSSSSMKFPMSDTLSEEYIRDHIITRYKHLMECFQDNIVSLYHEIKTNRDKIKSFKGLIKTIKKGIKDEN